MAKIDLSDLGATPVVDLTDLGATPVDSAANEMSQGEALRRGIAEGGTFGFSGETGGVVQAGLDLLGKLGIGTSVSDVNKQLAEQGFKGDIGPTSTADVYSTARAEEESALKKAEQLYPKTTMAGEIAGSIPTMLAATGPLKLAEAGIKGGIKAGAKLGAITGAGKAEDISDIPAEVITGATTGAISGAIIPGVVEATRGIKSGISKLGDLQSVQNILKSRQYGKQGESLIGATAEQETFGKLRDNARSIIEKINKEVTDAGEAINKAKKATEDEMLPPEQLAKVKEKLAKAKDKINEMIPDPTKASPGERESVDKALKLIDDYSTQVEQKTAKATTFKPDIEQVVEAKPSTVAKLQDEAARLTEQARLSGENASFEVMETVGQDGKKYANLVKKTRDVASEQPEKIVPIKDANGEVLGEELLTGQGQQLKEGIKVKTLLSEPEIPSQKISIPQAPVEETVGYEARKPIEELTRKQVYGLEGTARQYSTYGQESLQSPKVAGQMSNLVKDLGEIVPEQVKKAREPFKALETTKSLLGLEAKGVEADLVQETDKLTRLLATSEKEGLTPAQRSAIFDQIEESLGKTAPELAQQLKGARSTAEKYDLIQDLKKQSFLGKLVGAAIGGAGGATVGGGFGAAAGAAAGATVNPAMIANIEGLAERKIGQVLTNLSPKGMETVSKVLSTAGSAGNVAAKKIAEASNKDQIGRNALMFSMQQDPKMRKLLKKKLGFEDGN